jgi:hypothetical protein
MVYAGRNPPSGGIIDYWLGASTPADPGSVSLTVRDGAGNTVAVVPVGEPRARAVNRVVWNLRMALGVPEEGRRGPQGPPVLPGRYTVRLTAGGVIQETPIVVWPDPREQVADDVRVAWTEALLNIQLLGSAASRLYDDINGSVSGLDDSDRSSNARKARDLLREVIELRSRLGRLAGSVSGHVGPLTGDEQAQWDFLGAMLMTLSGEWTELTGGE